MESVTHERLLDLLDRAVSTFQQQFGRGPQYAAVAPGRVNLIGEHTDYNLGLVMPLAIDRYTVIVGGTRATGKDHFIAADLNNESAIFDRHHTLNPDNKQWANYIKGVMQQFLDHSHTIPAIDAVIASDIPIGSGLSSSAALCVSTATMLEHITGIHLNPIEKAQWCQQAEHDFANVPCGLMDHCICAMGQEDHALILDCAHLETQQVPLNTNDLAILVIHSGVSHSLASGEYAKRREQCQQAVQQLKLVNHTINSLRDATLQDLDSLNASHPLSQTIYNRAHHVITENDRVLKLANALANKNYTQVGQLMYDSHESLKTKYDVSCHELDTLVNIARNTPDVIGSRMTGGGFGGCAIALTKPQNIKQVTQNIAAQYQQKTNIIPLCFPVKPSRGAHALRMATTNHWKIITHDTNICTKNVK